jgi:hypothetical protein
MNKLLQHIVDAGDVDHKILPTYQMRGEVKYDNIPSPASMRNKAELELQFKKMQAAKNQAAQNAQRYGVIRQAEAPQSMASKAWSIATNPMTALAYKIQGRDIPDYLERGPKNSLDIAANMVNPFAVAEAVRSIPGNIARGEFVDAGLNALNVIPAAKVASKALKTAAPGVNKAVQAFGPNNSNKGFINFMTTREGVKFYPKAVAKDYKRGIEEGLIEAVPNALGSALRKTGIYPKARTIGRPFSEVFPRGAKKAEAITAQDEAFDRAMDFVNEYHYPGGSQELRPALADKIRSIYPNVTGSAENFNRLSNGNPFDLTNNRLATSTTWGAGREGLDISDINYINRKRGSIGGYNDTNNIYGGNSITLRNYGPYYKTPYDVAKIVVHEAGHTAQKLGYMPNFKNPSIVKTPLTWGDEIAKYDDELEYFTSNPETGLGRLYGKSMIVPDRSKPYKTSGAWESSPNELHSELMSEKYVDYLKSFDPKNPNVGLQNKTLNTKVIDELANPSDETLKRILDRGRLDKHFRPETTAEDRLKLLRMLPAAVPAIGAGVLGTREQKYGGENNMFRVFAQEGLEYKGPSIVDYLATKGYSGNKAFRKGLAEKYGIEGYDYSAAKNTELLNRLRENDDLLEQNYQPTQAAIPVERMMEMESQARAARQAAAQNAVPPPAQRPVNPGNYYTYSPDYGDMRIPQPKINTSLQPKVKYDKFSLSPQMVIPLPFGFGKQTPSEIPNSEITDPVRNVPARPKLNFPQYNPFVKPVAKPELGPFTSERYDDVQEVDPVNQQGAPEFLFNSEKLFNSFNRPKQKPLLPVVIPAKKPVVKTEKYTKPEVEELPWYEEAANAVTNTLKGFYDDFAQSVEKSPFDFRGMNFGTPVSPQGATEMTRDLTKRGLSLFSPDLAEKYNNWINRQQAIKNMDKDPVSKIVVPDFDYAPMYITGDTIPDAGGRQYHIPESMDLNALKFGVRNRGDFTPIDTEAASITAFHPFVDSKLYFTQIADDPANATYLGITPDGQVQVGGRKDVENKDIKITRVFSNKVVDFIKDPTGGIKKVPAGAKVNKNAFSPAVTVIGDDGKQKEGKLNLVVPQGTKADDAFGVATGGRFIFQTPDGQSRLVSGSLSNIEQEFKRIKGKNPYVTVISLDNGSFSRGLRTFDKRLTSVDLRSYDNLNSGGGNFAYLLPNQQTSRPLAKFDEFEKEATKRLQALYPGKKVSVEYQDTGLYNQTGGRDIQTQADIQKKGNSQTGVSLHNFNAARDYVLYVDGKPISGDQNNKAGNDIYKEVLWKAADKTGIYHIDDWDVGHIGLAKEGQKTAFDELKSKYPEIFTDPNFVKSLEFINKNKSNPTYQEYYELLNNIQPFTGQPRITEFEKRKGITKKAYGGPILDPRGQWAHPGKVTRIPGSDITMQGVPYPVLGIGNNGKKQMMYPGQEYNFGGASYVDEYPMMQKGGWSGGGLSRSDLATMAALNKNVNKKKYAHDHDTRITVEDGSLKEGYKDMRNFMQYWLTERAKDPKFTEWANRRLSVLDNLSGKYKTYTNKDIETGNAPYNTQAFYTNEDSSLNFNTDSPTSFSAPVQIHELTHKMDNEDNIFYDQPRWFWDANLYSTPDSFISKQVIPKNKKFQTNRYVGDRDEYDYLSRPTEMNARLNEFRYHYNLDPKKKYTAEDMKKIINDHNNYKGSFKNLRDDLFNSSRNNMESFDNLLKIIGNDPQKLADLHNNVVKNKTSYASDAMPQAKNGGYTVTRSNDRKGKTHKVTGPDGTVKYFGDSKLGQHPKDPERKKAFYARHKKNLAGNPFFRAFARKTWEDGGQTDYMQGGGLWDTDKVAYLDSTVNANRNLEFIRRAVENDGLSIPTPKGAPGYGKGMTSSHLMTYDPKSRRSYPELVNINGTLKYLTGDDAYNYAEDTGEYIQFPTAEQANYFSQNYKKSNYVKVGKQPLEKKHGIKVTYKK